ncbi:MAG: transglycosylase SLT domain-containing protein [Bacteroidales bacterium]|nr:transglycosylase SLT domain-containing protein [Bacteroidales bacterium]NLK80840.1 transglycosylase SLT domain-containing protein [Bacteroidales bacterium]HPY81762.1 transglycosylase SLT domain-containing protein [Bacteroidales bacterium]
MKLLLSVFCALCSVVCVNAQNSAPQDSIIDTTFSANLDEMINLWYVQAADTYKYKNRPETVDTAFVPTFSREQYAEYIANMQSIIPLTYNNYVHSYIQVYGFRYRERVEIMLGLAEYYFPMFEDILTSYDIPQELKYLAIIESALNPRARSKAGAMGLWQFMPATGKMFGLSINSFIDERRDPFQSTHAAAQYLKQLHGIFNDWILAIAAYNCGPGNVRKAITRSGGKRDFWEIYAHLPRETRGYVPAYIAAFYVFEHHELHNLYPREVQYPSAIDTIMVRNAITFNQISQVIDMPLKLLEDLNPQYKLAAIPTTKQGSTLYLPVEYITPFLKMQDAIIAYRDSVHQDSVKIAEVNSIASNAQTVVYYTIKSGDNLSLIASWFHVRVSDIRTWNNIKGNTIVAGRRLQLYVPEHKQKYYEALNTMSFTQKQRISGNISSPQKTQETANSGSYELYTVRSGDTLWDIANKYESVSAEDLRTLNNLSKSSKIHPGMVLKIRKF